MYVANDDGSDLSDADWEAEAEAVAAKEAEKEAAEAARKKADAEERTKREEAAAAEKAAARAAAAAASAAAASSGTGAAAPENKKAAGKLAKAPMPDRLRSPILCIMGHVDSGKTKLLDKMRRTNVQDREAGGITQQIGATFFPKENLLQQCMKVDSRLDLKVPGLLVIDTPGHASFNNLRKRGSSLCDLAILVVDITHGVQPQTSESIQMLRARNCPFVVALNKVDRIFGWHANEMQSFLKTIKSQKKHVQETFSDMARKCLLELTEQHGLNCALYWENKEIRKYVSCVPTSAHTGEGIPDLLALVVKLNQELMARKIALDEVNHEITVLEVKNVEGLGTTIDVVLVSGVLHEGDTIVVAGMQGPIVTTVRALLTPQPMKELRIKSEYVHHKVIYAAMGIKIAAANLEGAVAGTSVLVAKNPHDPAEIERLKEEVQTAISDIFKTVDKTSEGVYVVASTLGSLEALLDFLKESEIPVAGINIGTVHKLDVKKASTMRERGQPQYSVILAFDVKIDPEAEKEAAELGVQIFSDDVIYHLLDFFTKHLDDWKEEQRRIRSKDVIFPCLLKVLSEYIFNKKDPLIMGVRVEDGVLKLGTPLVAVGKENKVKLGNVESIELNKKSVQQAVKGQEVCIKITGESNVTYGKSFDSTYRVCSNISRASIDVMKDYFRDDLKEHAPLVVRLKGFLDII